MAQTVTASKTSIQRPSRILISAYACEPGRGSEPGIGWNWVEQTAQRHSVWVFTRANNRSVIEKRLEQKPLPNATFVYFDLPSWARVWKRGQFGFHLYYQLWQILAYFKARNLHKVVKFDLVHHITIGAYWKPSYLALLPIPFVWGPVGGGESSPPILRQTQGLHSRLLETVRGCAQFCSQLDPFVRLTARRAVWGFATTEETERHLRRIGCPNISVVPQAALPAEEIDLLGRIQFRESGPLRIISIGRLLHWKGFDLALQAFAKFHAEQPDSEYWIIGDGPERERLRNLAQKLGLEGHVTFWGQVERTDLLAKLAACDLLAHPSLHDSGGWACLEALAAGRPVVCLDCGGPGMMVNDETGAKIPPKNVGQVVADICEAFKYFSSDRALLTRMGRAARIRVRENFAWDVVGRLPDHVMELAAR